MTHIPEPYTINLKEWQALHAASRNMEAAQAAMNMFADRIKGQIAAAQEDARNTWSRIAADNPQLDMKNINWEPSDIPGQLVPVAMRLAK